MSGGFAKFKLPEKKIQLEQNNISSSIQKIDNLKISHTNIYNKNLLNGYIWVVNTHIEDKVIHLQSDAYTLDYLDGLLIRFVSVSDAFDQMYIKLNNLHVHPMNKAGALSFKQGDIVIVKYNANNRVFLLDKIIPSKRLIFSPEEVKDFNKLTYPADFITWDLGMIKNSPINVAKVPISVKVIACDNSIIQQISFIDMAKKKSYYSRYSKFKGSSWINWESTNHSNLDFLLFALQKPMFAEDIDGSTVIIKNKNSKNDKYDISKNNHDNLLITQSEATFSEAKVETKISKDNFDPYNKIEVNDQLSKKTDIEYLSVSDTDSFGNIIDHSINNDNSDITSNNIEINRKENTNNGKNIMNKSNKSDKFHRAPMHLPSNHKAESIKPSRHKSSDKKFKNHSNTSLHIKKPVNFDEANKSIKSKFSPASEKLRTQILKLGKKIPHQKFASENDVSNDENLRNSSTMVSKNSQNSKGSLAKKLVVRKINNPVSKNTVSPFSISAYKDLLVNKSNSKGVVNNFQNPRPTSSKAKFGAWNNGGMNKKTISGFNTFSNNSKLLSNVKSTGFLKQKTSSLLKKNDFSSIKTSYSNINNRFQNLSSSNFRPMNRFNLQNKWSSEANRGENVTSKFSQNTNSYSGENMANKSRITIANLSPTIG